MRYNYILFAIFTLLQLQLLAQTSDTIYMENWEDGIGNWYPSNGVWEVGTPTAGPSGAYSGQNCAATILDGNYPASSNTRLTSPISPSIILPAVANGEKILLRFYHWYLMETAAAGNVQIAVNGGSWITITGKDFIGNASMWTQYIADLTPYAGSSIKLGFLFTSSSFLSYGWYIDDIIIEKKQLFFNNPEDFETGIGDWYSDNGVWQVGIPTNGGPSSAHSGLNCVATVIDGNYPANCNATLISPEIKLTAEQNEIPVLYFWQWFVFANTTNGEVIISTNNGQWQTIAGPFTGTSGVWTQYVVDLSSYTDSTIRLGFLFSSDPFLSEGWYIDDIRIDGLQSTVVTNLENDVAVQWLEPESNPLCGTSNEQPVTIRLENKGLNAISNIKAGYSIDNGVNWVNETVFRTIEPGAVLDYTFQRKAAMAIADSFICLATVSVPYDINDTNNTISKVVHNDRLVVEFSVTETQCNEATGTAEITNISGREGPFNIYWNTGDEDMIAEKLGAGIYYVTIKDFKGCSWTRTVAINDEGAPEYSEASSVISDVSCYGGKDGSIYIYPTGGLPPYTYRWSTGETGQDISGLSKGQYDLTIKDSKGCSKTHSFTIGEPEPIKIAARITDADCGELNGSIELTVTGGTEPYTYNWSSGPSSSLITNLGEGLYTAYITDFNSCMNSIKVTINEINAPEMIVTSVTPAACGSFDGSVNITMADSTSDYIYIWSNGSLAEDLVNATSGQYYVRITNVGGLCSSNQLVEIPVKLPPPGIICMVSIDSLTDEPFIVMNLQETPNQIASYNIFQLGKTGTYQYMDSQEASITNTSTDAGSSPDVTSYRYRATTVDYCGNESEPGPFHETIHTVVTPDFNLTRANLLWNSYKGIEYTYFMIYRYSYSDGMEIIDTVPKTEDTDFYTYTDLNPPLNDSVYYVIVIPLPEPCITTKKATSHNSVRSNKSKKLNFGGENNSGSESIKHFSLYPNPNKGSFSVSAQISGNQDVVMNIYDAQGRLILNTRYDNIPGQFEKFVEIAGVNPGIFYLQLITKDGMISKSFVIE